MVNRELLREISKPALFLAGFALLGTFALANVYQITLPKVQENERVATLAKLNELIPATRYDNDLLASKQELPAAAFGSAETVSVYRALKQQQPVAALF
ncbi:MAG: electron transport complex subunit G, partial [Thiothrix sp.]